MLNRDLPLRQMIIGEALLIVAVFLASALFWMVLGMIVACLEIRFLGFEPTVAFGACGFISGALWNRKGIMTC